MKMIFLQIFWMWSVAQICHNDIRMFVKQTLTMIAAFRRTLFHVGVLLKFVLDDYD